MKKSNSGQGLTEYLMLVMLIAIVSLAIVKSIGAQVKVKLTTVRDNIMREVTLGD
jgi:Flp pilus assembly pilin Flp